MEKVLSNFYITTPIYYVNDKPHIGHAYTTILADVLARYYRLLGIPTFFLTGTDEHGQKVEQAAVRNGVTPIHQCDSTVVRFQELWRKLEITNDDFIRTTEERHKKVVTEILQELYDRGEIYKSNYQGSYCVPCERFYTEKDLTDARCPECRRPLEQITEANYFFRMGKYQQWLIDTINANPDFIQPAHRRNETLGFLRKPLEDLCISRPKARLSWGIELPFDSEYVCYVWFDALINYISAIGFNKKSQANFNKWWPATYHLIGKDILTTHTVYWPIMLKAIGISCPKSIFAHGWWLVGRDKMGKSLGNVVDPMMMCDKYGVDPFRYYLLAEMTLGQDASFTEQHFINRYNNDLADGLGNMLNRVIKLINRYFGGSIPTAVSTAKTDKRLQEFALDTVEIMEDSIIQMKLDRGLARVMECVRKCNQYFEQTTPWKLAKEGNQNRLSAVLYTSADVLRIVSGLLYPVMPTKMETMRRVLGVSQEKIEPTLQELREWGKLKPFSKVEDITSLFPRIEIDNPGKKEEQTVIQSVQNKDKKRSSGRNSKKGTENLPANADGNIVDLIDIKDFSKIRLKTAKVVAAEPIPNTDRLLRLQLEVGDERRQIVAGVAEFYQPEALLGRVIVIVANLKPTVIKGTRSEGMLLVARSGKNLNLLTVDGDCMSGASVG